MNQIARLVICLYGACNAGFAKIGGELFYGKEFRR
jgi:hypothetical protein